MADPESFVDDLAAFVVASPSSFHAAAEGARRLRSAGFVEQDERDQLDVSPGGHVVVRDGALLAWRVPADVDPTTGFRVLGAHTDSPGFVVKPNPDFDTAGWQQINVEIYGSPLLNSWLDRDLGLAGRLILADGSQRLVQSTAIMRIPQLAIHLDRSVNDEGLKLDRQFHTSPVWGVGSTRMGILDYVAGLVDVSASDVGGYELVAFDTAAPVVLGPDGEFFASARLDNLSSVHAGLTALTEHDDSGAITMFAAFDHEEVGSGSRSGAAGPVLAELLQRITFALGGDAEAHFRALAASVCLSSDTGHAVHPNYVSRHDHSNQPLLNGGPLLKINANQRYASNAVGAALWRRACRAAGVTTQEFVSTNNLPCGSTIGPLTATRLGMTTVDVGAPLLSMHSARELAGTEDLPALTAAMKAFLVLED
jgi:aspartyl aminopeptidase